jgi:hypothetical protein
MQINYLLINYQFYQRSNKLDFLYKYFFLYIIYYRINKSYRKRNNIQNKSKTDYFKN